MKKLKKLLSIVLAVAMVMSLAVSVGATTYCVTINSEKSGHTYVAYQIFSGTVYDNSGTLVLSDIQWGESVDSSSILASLQSSDTTIDDQGTTLGSLFSSCTTAADVAKVLDDYGDDSVVAQAFADFMSANVSKLSGTSTESTSPYTISDLESGYYLIKDNALFVAGNGDAYTDIILKVIGADRVINEKAVYPSVEKTVSDVDANIGDTVTYNLVGYIPDTSAYTTYIYTFSDTLSKGLTYTADSLSVAVYKVADTTSGFTTITGYYTPNADTGIWETVDTTQTTSPEQGVTYYTKTTDLTSSTGYTLDVGTYSSTDGTSISVALSSAKTYSDSYVVVTYTATVNENAVIGGDGNPNTVYITYSNNPNTDGTGKTENEKVVTWTFELDITKVDGEDNSIKLENVEFVLYQKVTEGTDEVTYYVTVDNDGKVTGWTQYLDGTETGYTQGDVLASHLTTDSDGLFSVIGLDAGTYYLKEVKTNDGYNLLTSDVEVVITPKYEDTNGDGVLELTGLTATVGGENASADVSDGKISSTIENNKGETLPETGGIGVTIFYVVGGILVLAAAGVIVISKKRRTEK